MDSLTNLGAFIPLLGVIVFLHEFGHFITAKAFGIRVPIFSLGFGKRLLGFQWGDTDCRLSLIPLGGYVKLEGEPDDLLSEHVESTHDERDFTSRPRWQRIVVYLAGPVMNVILTLAVLTGLYMVGLQVDAAVYDRPIIGAVAADSPALAGGLLPGDEILAIDGLPQEGWKDVDYSIAVRPDADIVFRVRRGGQEQNVTVHSGATERDKIGTVGINPLVRIGEVLEGGPADESGLRSDDAVLRIDDQAINTFGDIVPLVAVSEGKPLRLQILRAGEHLTLEVTPRDDGSGPLIGVRPKMVVKQFGPLVSLREAARWTWNMTLQTFDVLKRLVTARISPKTMMGPLGIAGASGDAARAGAVPYLYLIAVISLQIGILNLLPVPPLDGGQLTILFGESIVRRDFSERIKLGIMNAGLVALLLLIGLVVYSDLSKTSLLSKYLP